jgi:hypothetical protein
LRSGISRIREAFDVNPTHYSSTFSAAVLCLLAALASAPMFASAGTETVPMPVSADAALDPQAINARFAERIHRARANAERIGWAGHPIRSQRGAVNPDVLPDAADWLLTQQQVNGGFPFTAGETATPANVQAPILASLLRAWRRTQNPAYLSAATAAGDFLRDNPNRFTAGNNSRRFTGADAFAFQELSRATGDPQYVQIADTEFWAPLAAGNYGPAADWGIAEFIQSEFDRRPNIEEVVAWDLGWAAIAAFEAGQTALLPALLDGIVASLETNPELGGALFDLVGLTGAVWAAARIGVDLDPQTGLFAAADSTADLAAELLANQDPASGGFYFNTTFALTPEDPTATDSQVTAFAMLGLDLLDRTQNAAALLAAAGYLESQQQANGQILPFPGASPTGSGGVEIHAESMAAFATTALRPGVIRSVAETGDLPTTVDNDYTRINNAIQTALDDDVLELQGTFDWSEPNAIQSWWSLWPQGVDRVTIRPVSLNAATIAGPGDLPQFDLEGVFGGVGRNHGWEVSGLRFDNVDNAIGLFFFSGFSPPGTRQFDGTRILDNTIVLPRDLDAAGEELQNIAIHYSFGNDQRVADNVIRIPGDGLDDPLTTPLSKNVGIQSNASSVAYEGLVIEDNLVEVLNAPSAEPANIIGYWENGGATARDITVRGNRFVNLDPANDPGVNRQEGFRLVSQSAVYRDNQAEGARFGFRWLPDDEFGGDFSAADPVDFIGNTVRNNATGISLEANGAGDFRCNLIFGNDVGIANNTAAVRPSQARVNWWGCNGGPGSAGCDGVSDASVDTAEWLIATLTATPDTIPLNDTSALEAALIETAGGSTSIDLAGCVVPDGLGVDFNGGSRGAVAPPSTSLGTGIAGATFTPSATGTASDVSATFAPGEQVFVTIEITDIPELTVAPASVDFGSVVVGETGGPLPFTLENSGTVALTIDAIGSPSAPFFLSAGGSCAAAPFVLQAGESCTVEHEFAPGMTGLQTEGIAIVSNAGSSPDSVVLLGTGIAPAVLLDPMAIDFGDQALLQTSDRVAVSLSNNGDATLNLVSLAFGGSHPGDFQIFSNTCTAGLGLAPGGSCGFEIEFTPSALGPREASLDIETDAASSPDILQLSGVGVEVLADLAVTLGADPNFVGTAEPIDIVMAAENLGPLDADGAEISFFADAGLAVIGWTCTASGGATCPAASGGGSPNLLIIDLPAGGRMEFLIEASLIEGGPGEQVTNSAELVPPATPPDPNLSNNTAELVTRTGLFADGFE